MRRRQVLPMIVVPVVGALVATASLAAAEPVEDRSQPGGPATASTSAAFRGPRWEQPETVPSVDAPRASTEEFATVEVRAADRSGNPVEGASYSIYDLDLDLDLDLAAVRVRYAAQAVDSCGGTYIGPHLAGTRSPLAYGTTFRLPTQRTEFYTPESADDVAWYTEFGQTTADCSFDAYDTLTNTPTRYPRRGPYTASWNTAPLAPRTATDADGRPTALRHGDTMAIGVPMYVDSQPGHADLGDLPAGATGTVKLFHGERLVAESPSPLPLTSQVPPDAGDYRLTANAERNVGWSTLATRTETTWTFRSRTTPEALALPLINARYRLALDDHNRAPANVPVRLSVHFEHPLSIVHVRLSISHDEGGTWRPVTLTGSGDQRHALLRHPAGGSVSLRLEAHDREGNGITQTLIRAYVTR